MILNSVEVALLTVTRTLMGQLIVQVGIVYSFAPLVINLVPPRPLADAKPISRLPLTAVIVG